MSTKINKILVYEGSNHLRYRLLLSTLSGKPVKITNIRTKNDDPGLKGNILKYKSILFLLTLFLSPYN